MKICEIIAEACVVVFMMCIGITGIIMPDSNIIDMITGIILVVDFAFILIVIPICMIVEYVLDEKRA